MRMMPHNVESTDSYKYVLMKDEESVAGSGDLHYLPSSQASRNFKISSISVGMLVGFLVQEATLAANVVILEVWGNEFARTSRKEIIVFSLLWSFITSAMAIILLGFLRALMTSFFRSLPIDTRFMKKTESVHRKLVESLEVLFVVGALVGVSLAWVVTDMFLGMQPQINFSVLTLGMSLLWCKVVVSCRSRAEEQVGGEEKDEESMDSTEKDSTLLVV